MTKEIKIKETTKDIFCQALEEKVQDEQVTYLEALSSIMEECDADEMMVARLLTDNIKKQIKLEAIENRLLKGITPEPTLDL